MKPDLREKKNQNSQSVLEQIQVIFKIKLPICFQSFLKSNLSDFSWNKYSSLCLKFCSLNKISVCSWIRKFQSVLEKKKKFQTVLEIKILSTVFEIKHLVCYKKNQISSLFLKLTFEAVLENKISVFSGNWNFQVFLKLLLQSFCGSLSIKLRIPVLFLKWCV